MSTLDCFVNCFSSNEKEEILPGSELLFVLQSLHSHLNFQAQTLIESSTNALENMSLSNRDLPRTKTLPVRIKRHSMLCLTADTWPQHFLTLTHDTLMEFPISNHSDIGEYYGLLGNPEDIRYL